MYKILSACVVLYLCLPSILCLSEEMQDLLNMLHNTCQGQTGADEGIIKKAQGGDFTDDDKFKCYLKCCLMEMSIISDDGVVDIEAAVALLPPDMIKTVEPAMRKCGPKTGADACDSAYLTFKCVFENTKDFFLP